MLQNDKNKKNYKRLSLKKSTLLQRYLGKNVRCSEDNDHVIKYKLHKINAPVEIIDLTTLPNSSNVGSILNSKESRPRSIERFYKNRLKKGSNTTSKDQFTMTTISNRTNLFSNSYTPPKAKRQHIRSIDYYQGLIYAKKNCNMIDNSGLYENSKMKTFSKSEVEHFLNQDKDISDYDLSESKSKPKTKKTTERNDIIRSSLYSNNQKGDTPSEFKLRSSIIVTNRKTQNSLNKNLRPKNSHIHLETFKSDTQKKSKYKFIDNNKVNYRPLLVKKVKKPCDTRKMIKPDPLFKKGDLIKLYQSYDNKHDTTLSRVMRQLEQDLKSKETTRKKFVENLTRICRENKYFLKDLFKFIYKSKI